MTSSNDKPTLDDLKIDRGDEEAGERPVWPWVLAGLVIAALAGWWLTRPDVAHVTTVPVRQQTTAGPATVLDASGYVTARRAATVSSKVTGKIVELLVEEGMAVDEGQLLARLDDATQRAALRLGEAQASAAASALAETEIRLEEALLELQRLERLAGDGFSSLAELDTARAEADAQAARLATQRDQVAVAERQVELARQGVDDTEIRAPFAGVVVTKDAQPGEMISPVSAGGGFTRTGICTVVDMSSLEIEVDVNEAYIHRVRPGQAVEAVLDAYPDWRIAARVITIVPTADRQKATVMVRIGFAEIDQRILPEMGVKVSFIAAVEDDGGGVAGPSARLLVPRSAVRTDGEQDVVFVVSQGRAERRAVRVGDATGDEVSIDSGLVAGERVVVDGSTELADGDQVKETR